MPLCRMRRQSVCAAVSAVVLFPQYAVLLQQFVPHFEGMSYQQAAKVMGKSVKQITNMVYRGKERLRGLLKREGITNVEK